MQRKAIALLYPMLVAACGGGGGGAPSASATASAPSASVTPPVAAAFNPVTARSCSQSDWSVMPAGDYGVTNNLWGKGTLANFSQCIEGTSVGTVLNGAAVQTGISGSWKWDWPVTSDFTVKSYAEFIYLPDNGTFKPMLLNKVDNVTMTHDASVSATGDYNLTYDLWIDSTSALNQWPHKAELMIKVASTWPDSPVVDTLVVDGITYDVAIAKSYNDQWIFISFLAHTPALKAKIRLKPFVDYLLAKGTLAATDYLTKIEFGSELIRGTGTVTVNSYAVTR